MLSHNVAEAYMGMTCHALNTINIQKFLEFAHVYMQAKNLRKT